MSTASIFLLFLDMSKAFPIVAPLTQLTPFLIKLDDIPGIVNAPNPTNPQPQLPCLN